MRILALTAVLLVAACSDNQMPGQETSEPASMENPFDVVNDVPETSESEVGSPDDQTDPASGAPAETVGSESESGQVGESESESEQAGESDEASESVSEHTPETSTGAENSSNDPDLESDLNLQASVTAVHDWRTPAGASLPRPYWDLVYRIVWEGVEGAEGYSLQRESGIDLYVPHTVSGVDESYEVLEEVTAFASGAPEDDDIDRVIESNAPGFLLRIEGTEVSVDFNYERVEPE